MDICLFYLVSLWNHWLNCGENFVPQGHLEVKWTSRIDADQKTVWNKYMYINYLCATPGTLGYKYVIYQIDRTLLYVMNVLYMCVFTMAREQAQDHVII